MEHKKLWNHQPLYIYIYMYQTRGLQSNLLGGWALFGGWVHWQWLMTSLLRSHPGITGGFVVSMWNDAMFNGINHPSDSSKKMRFSTLLSHAAPEIHHHSTIPSHCEVMIKFIHWFQPLWNISQLGWLFSIYEKIRNVPNHQSVQILHCNSSVYIPMFHGFSSHQNSSNKNQSVGCWFL